MWRELINVLISIKDILLSLFNTIIGILQTLRFGFQSLTIGIINIAKEVLGDLGGLIYYGWETVGDLIGGPATVIISSMLLIIMVRIIIAFVFKIFRLNIDYEEYQRKSYKANTSPYR